MHRLSQHLSIILSLITIHCCVAAPSRICADISSRLPGKVTYPGDKAYNISEKSYAYANQQTQQPSCIVQPTTTEDVATAVKLLKKAPQVSFAVRSGGHATNRGFSNIDGGVTLDLTAINSVNIQADGVTVSVGTGASWGDVYLVLDAAKRSLNGGRASGVGVGGFLTGGGIGFFALKNGFGCDAVTNVEIVLPNGSIINANAKSHRDLFVAIKGGANNFGIVTRWDIKTISKGKIWGGGVIYPNATVPAQLDAFTKWKNPANFDSASSVEQSYVYIGSMKQWLVSNSLIYTEPVAYPKDLKVFTDIQPQIANTLRFSNVTDFADEIQSQSTPDQYTIFATTTVKISPTILTKVHALWQASVARMAANNATITSSLTLQSIPAPPSDPSRANSLGFNPSSTPQKDLVLVLCSSFWADPAVGTQVKTAVAGFINDAEYAARKEGVLQNFKYPNYAAADFQNPLKSNGVRDRLRVVALNA
ncbi:FAD binding domain-containing protein [Pochonia chlamydosporia 170]|uniref:FAD binding domain-containing protein n=1 Tax=Pochonia chlamydosporia 170 TaxID=1380566 RepID=A0A179F298_METCM|nr:FAD binding domain-containing protein [Pochonia chlamydosporia 170]OAQ59558.2 FAD binding domain-containing protein [Pochonia chlamydosporia 170]